MKKKLSVVMITQNSSRLLHKSLNSVKNLANEIVIVDDNSTDNTVKIAKKFKARIYLHHQPDLGKQRTFALTKSRFKWILFLDSDEVISRSLKKEINKILNEKESKLAYLIPFQNHLLGKQINFGGEYYSQLRLFNKNAVNIYPAYLHEKVGLKRGTPDKLDNKIYHHSYQSFHQIIKKFTKYAIAAAYQKKSSGEKTSLKKILIYPLHMFWARFINDRGYKDGLFRITLDLGFAYMEFLTYIAMLVIPKITKTKRILRVAIDAGDFCPGTTTVKSGITRIVDGFIAQIEKDNIDALQVYVYFFNGKKNRNIKNIFYKKLPEHGFSSLFLPLQIIRDRADVFIGFSSHIPRLLNFSNTKKIAFLYDLGFIKYSKYYSEAEKLSRQITQSIKRSDKIVVLTKTIQKQLLNKYPTIKDKLFQIYPGVDHLTLRNLPQANKYFLYVGVLKPMKNIEELFNVFYQFLLLSEDRSYKLVIIGQKVENYYRKLKQNLIYRKISKSVVFKETVPDSMLAGYYAQATAVLNISHEEGFGFPVVEALYMGKPVIVNNLKIYSEFEKEFRNLYIGTSREIIVKHMVTISGRKSSSTRQVKQPVDFTWECFTNRVISLVKSQP